MKTKYILAAIALTGSLTGMAQKPCSTDEMRQKYIQKNPQILQIEEQQEQFMQGAKVMADTTTLFIVPIVFHVLHNFGQENISDEQVIDAVRIINEDFRKQNADYTTVQAPFKPADAKIEFRLARKDAYGNCTNGIERITTAQTYIGDDGSKDVIDHAQWPRSRYLNVWVVANISSGAAGYALLPASASVNPDADGIMILHNYIGSIGTGNYALARALTHEIGHWLNLQHVWGNSNTPGVTCGNDGVTDTPVTKGWTNCDLVNNKICNASIVENVENFMEYSYCDKMFSKGQRDRMRTALTSSTAQRNNLYTTTNLSNTGVSLADVLCNAEFKASATLICEGDNVTFTENSWNGQPANWDWTLQGGNPGNSNDTAPVINYPTAGQYDVTLSVSNGSGSPSKTKTGYIHVSPLAAQYNSTNFTESFEGGQATLNNEWIVNDMDGSGNSWKAKASVAYTGSYSMWIDNWNEDSTDIEEIVSPSFDLSVLGTPKLYFKLAYAQYTSTSPDNLRIYISRDCGKSWFLRYNKSGAQIKSVTNPVTSPWTPSGTSQWKSDSMSIPAPYSTSSNIRFKFYWKNGYGNNVYLDDINVKGLTTGIREDLASRIGFMALPNPTDGQTEMTFELPAAANVTLKIYDMLGKEIGTLMNENNLSSGLHRYSLDCSTYNKGIYFAKLSVDRQQFVQKIVVR